SKRDWSSDVCSSDLRFPVRKIFRGRTGVLRCPWTSWPAVSGVASGELFDELQQCRVVEPSVPLILEGCKELGHLCTDRDRHADQIGRASCRERQWRA